MKHSMNAFHNCHRNFAALAMKSSNHFSRDGGGGKGGGWRRGEREKKPWYKVKEHFLKGCSLLGLEDEKD